MGLTFEKVVPKTGPAITSDRRLYLAKDGTTVVEAKDKRAHALLVGEGCELERALAVELKLGLDAQGRIVLDCAEGIPEPLPEVHGIVADRRLAIARGDKGESVLVEPDDPRASVILASEGDTIPGVTVKEMRLSIVEGKVVQRAEGETDDDLKARLIGRDKRRAPGADKMREPGSDKQQPPAPPAPVVPPPAPPAPAKPPKPPKPPKAKASSKKKAGG